MANRYFLLTFAHADSSSASQVFRCEVDPKNHRPIREIAEQKATALYNSEQTSWCFDCDTAYAAELVTENGKMHLSDYFDLVLDEGSN